MGSRSEERWSGAIPELRSLWIHRRTLRSLVRHDRRKSYAGTAGGLAWSLATPLVTILVFSLIFTYGIRLPLGNAPYAIGFATAYVPWLLLSMSVTGAAGSLIEHRYMVKRVVFPIEIIPADPLLVHTLPHLFLTVVTAAICFAGGYGHFPEAGLLLYFYLCAAALAISAGLLLASLTVVVRDLQQVLPSLINLWFWITPIAWEPGRLPPAGRLLLLLNPAAYVVSGYRYAFMPKSFAAPGLIETAAFWSITVAMLVTATACFRRLRPHFWDCL